MGVVETPESITGLEAKRAHSYGRDNLLNKGIILQASKSNTRSMDEWVFVGVAFTTHGERDKKF